MALTPAQMEVLIDAVNRGVDPDFDYPNYLEALGTLLEEVGSDTTLTRVQELQVDIAKRKVMMNKYEGTSDPVLAEEEQDLLEGLEGELHRLYVLGPDVFKPESKSKNTNSFYADRYEATDKLTWPGIKSLLDEKAEYTLRPAVYREETEDGRVIKSAPTVQ